MTTAAATAALEMTVRASWPSITGTMTEMKTACRGLAGWRPSVVAIPDLPHHPDDVVAMVTMVRRYTSPICLPG